MKPIRVLIADDSADFRRALRERLEREPDLTVVGEAVDAGEAVRLARRLVPDVVSMDVVMPGAGGVSATREIRASSPAVAVLGLSMYGQAAYRRAMIEAGAAGYVEKRADFRELVEAIRQAAGGRGPETAEIRPEAGGVRSDAADR